MDADIYAIQCLRESLKDRLLKIDKNIVECCANLVKALHNSYRNKTAELSKNELLKKNITIKSMHMISKEEEYQFEEKSVCWLLECDKTQRIYEIRKLQPSPCCELKCTECNICYHTYTCTCFDYFVRTTICKHIHFIHTIYQDPEESVNGTKEHSNQNVDKLKRELLVMAGDIVDRLDDINDEDVLCTLQSQLQNSLMLLTYFSEENGSARTVENKEEDPRNRNGGVKRKHSEEIDQKIKKSLKN